MGDDDDCNARYKWGLVLPFVVEFKVVDNAFPIKKVSNIVKHFIKRAPCMNQYAQSFLHVSR